MHLHLIYSSLRLCVRLPRASDYSSQVLIILAYVFVHLEDNFNTHNDERRQLQFRIEWCIHFMNDRKRTHAWHIPITRKIRGNNSTCVCLNYMLAGHESNQNAGMFTTPDRENTHSDTHKYTTLRFMKSITWTSIYEWSVLVNSTHAMCSFRT